MTLGEGNLLNNRYRVVETLGRGGMGAVYRAVDDSLGVVVAVKENLFTTEDYARQFRQEAVILAGIRHPNLPRVTDHFVIENQGQYLVMDFIDGEDLRQILEKRGAISEYEAIRIGAGACDALIYLHGRKPPVFHRDIKLGNIKINDNGEVYLVDFGLAKMGWEDEETQAGARALTPGYSPPEQYGSARTDARTDIYSLGATLYAALTGNIPEDALMRAVGDIKLTPLREHRPEISARLAAVIEKALETNPSDRYQTAEEFRDALLDHSEPATELESAGNGQTAPVLTKGDAAPRHSSSFWRLSGYLLIMLIIVLGAVWFNLLNRGLFSTLPWPLLPFFTTPTSQPASTSLPLIQPTLKLVPTAKLTETASPTSIITLTVTAAPTLTPTITATATMIPTATATLTSIPTATATTGPSATETQLPVIPQATSQKSQPGEIGFASISNNVSQIFIINMDGTNQRPLTNVPAGACDFSWSPDAKQIVFVSPCTRQSTNSADSALYLMDVETGQTSALPIKPGGDFEPAWSPDGRKIAFTSLRDGSMQIYVYNLVDASLTALTQPVNYQSHYPAWSPDSSQIAYTSMRSGLLQIWSMNADGSNKHQLVRSGGSYSEYLPNWSVDGTFLIFSRTNTTLTAPSSLVRFDIQGGLIIPLPIPLPVVGAVFSPNGEWIAYETTDTKTPFIDICTFSDCQPKHLATTLPNIFDPVWRPGN